MTTRRESALASRIRSGLADPITDQERRIAAELRAEYVRKFGPLPDFLDRKDKDIKKTDNSTQ